MLAYCWTITIGACSRTVSLWAAESQCPHWGRSAVSSPPSSRRHCWQAEMRRQRELSPALLACCSPHGTCLWLCCIYCAFVKDSTCNLHWWLNSPDPTFFFFIYSPPRSSKDAHVSLYTQQNNSSFTWPFSNLSVSFTIKQAFCFLVVTVPLELMYVNKLSSKELASF